MASPSRPLPPPTETTRDGRLRWRGRDWLYFGGCDYLRLAHHPQILDAVSKAVLTLGLNVAASRRTTGNHPFYRVVEGEFAAWAGVEGALLTSSGTGAVMAAVQGTAACATHVFLDAWAHAGLWDAAATTSLPVGSFPHRDAGALARALTRLPATARPLVVTDGLFAHDGGVAPLPALLVALGRRGWLLVDDAHGLGILGPHGRGTTEHWSVHSRRMIVTGTGSKAFGVFGGIVLGSRPAIDRIARTSRAFAGSTPLPIAMAAGWRAALRLLTAAPDRQERLRQNTRIVKLALADVPGVQGLRTPGPVVAVVPRHAAASARLRRRLMAVGIYPTLIHYPGGPRGGYFRFALASEHGAADLATLVSALRVSS